MRQLMLVERVAVHFFFVWLMERWKGIFFVPPIHTLHCCIEDCVVLRVRSMDPDDYHFLPIQFSWLSILLIPNGAGISI